MISRYLKIAYNYFMKKQLLANHIIIYTDGGSRGNPGQAGIGIYIESLNKRYAEVIGIATNNVAEYSAVVYALKKCKHLLGSDVAVRTTVEIRCDSQLVVHQLNGVFKLKEKDLFELFIAVWNLKQEFQSVLFKHIPREENSVADSLVNQALDEREQGERTLF